jgi:predicted deacylase
MGSQHYIPKPVPRHSAELRADRPISFRILAKYRRGAGGGSLSGSDEQRTARAFELACPDLNVERVGNTGTEGIWHFDSGVPGRSVMVSALMHGNELCGAWALKEALGTGLRPRRGTLTLGFCNLAAFDRFDPQHPGDARYVDEDMNRVWSDDQLGHAHTSERRRAARILPWVNRADWLLDLHSMSQSDTPVQLPGVAQRNIDLALQIGNPEVVVSDAWDQPGGRMRDYGRFGESHDNGTRSLLTECGFHGARAARDVAIDQMARFLLAAGTLDRDDVPSQWLMAPAPRQRALRVTHTIAAEGTDFRFAQDWKGLEVLPEAGTLLGWSEGKAVTTPYDNCVLIMPSLANISAGVTVLRLARPLD